MSHSLLLQCCQPNVGNVLYLLSPVILSQHPCKFLGNYNASLEYVPHKSSVRSKGSIDQSDYGVLTRYFYHDIYILFTTKQYLSLRF
uniref:Uncharacterized protein n=1 Tax=Pararge aegeria TaxID=116150 RepID=S4PT22_9NEOP